MEANVGMFFSIFCRSMTCTMFLHAPGILHAVMHTAKMHTTSNHSRRDDQSLVVAGAPEELKLAALRIMLMAALAPRHL